MCQGCKDFKGGKTTEGAVKSHNKKKRAVAIMKAVEKAKSK